MNKKDVQVISWAFSESRHVSITLITLSLIDIPTPFPVNGSTFHVIMIMRLKVLNRITSVFVEKMMFFPFVSSVINLI